MGIEVVMPQMGQSVVEGTVVQWLKRVGEPIERDEPLVIISTDKVEVEVPAPGTGTLGHILVQEGETVPVQTVIAVIEEELAPASDSAPATAEPEPGEAEPAQVEPDADVIPFSPMRRAIAEHMVRSVQTAPHVTTFVEVDMSRLMALRAEQNAAFRARHGFSLTYTAYFVQAAARALRRFPQLNASVDGDGLLLKRDIHIGVAVALEDGLIVPVVRHADQKSLTELAVEVHDLASRARHGALAPADVQEGTFTITNPGVFGTLFGTPILHQPQVAILDCEAIVERPVAAGGQVVIRPMMYLGLSFDHRAVDGLLAARFLHDIKQQLETAR